MYINNFIITVYAQERSLKSEGVSRLECKSDWYMLSRRLMVFELWHEISKNDV